MLLNSTILVGSGTLLNSKWNWWCYLWRVWIHLFSYYLLAYLPEFVLIEHRFLVFSHPVWQPAVSGTMSLLIAILAMDVLPCNLSWIVLGLETLSSHVLVECIPDSGPVDWPCNGTLHCCMSIWVVLSLDSLSLSVLECYIPNSYSAHRPCNGNPPETTMSWLLMLCLLWRPSYFLELI